jgi:hypothetical protein
MYISGLFLAWREEEEEIVVGVESFSGNKMSLQSSSG